MTPLLWRASLRHLLRHPWQAALSMLGIALGVAVVAGIDVASGSALRAYAMSQEAVTGKATHQVVGGSLGLEVEVYERLREAMPELRAAPLVEGSIRVESADAGGGSPPRLLRLLGVDPSAALGLRSTLGGADRECTSCPPSGLALDLAALRHGEVPCALVREQAAELGIELGAPLRLRSGDRIWNARLAAVLAPEDRLESIALAGVLLTDVASAQRLLGHEGRLSRIDLILDGEREAATVVGLLPKEAQLLRSDRQTAASREMTRAFRFNLMALGLLALVCGLFLIYNTVTFSVLQRRALLGRLRALGVTRRQVLGLVLGEAAVVGAVGTALGILLGLALASGLVRLVTQTVDDLYFQVQVREPLLGLWDLVAAALLGLGGSLAAALMPALEATRTPVSSVLRRSAVETSLRGALPRLTSLGLALMIGGTTLLLLTEDLVPTFAGLFVAILGVAMLVPVTTVVLCAGLAAPSGRLFGVVGRLAVRGVAGSLSRTGVAIAALTVAVAVTVGVGLMIRSFRQSVDEWLGTALTADLYVRPAESGPARAGTLPAELVAGLEHLDGVVRVNTVRHLFLDGAERTHVMALDTDREGFAGFRVKSGRAIDLWRDFQSGPGVLVSEPYAFRHDVEPGHRIELHTDAGRQTFPVIGVYTDYASDQGVVLLSRQTYERHWRDREVSGVSVVAAASLDLGVLRERVRAHFGARDDLWIESSGALREASLAVFDRTFAVTGVLRLLVVLVAFVGVVSALMALQLERRRELATLRANGLTPGQLRALVAAQTGLLGLLSGLLALPVGVGLASAMVYLINRRSFGWSMNLTTSPGLLVQAVLLALAAALLAGLYPGARMARTSPAEALREE